jgi:hypothetical protein
VALEVDVDDRVPFLLGHVHDHPVPQDPGVVHQHVQVAERVDRGLDEALGPFPVGHVVHVGHALAAHGLDLVDHLLRRRPVVAGPVDVAAEVVDHDLGALGGEEQRVLAAEATSCTGDDGNAAVECTHDRQSPAREVVEASGFGPGAW